MIALIIIILFILILVIYKKLVSRKESFQNRQQKKHNIYDKSLFKGIPRHKKSNDKIYDRFYSNVYDRIVHQQMKRRIKFEVNNLIQNTHLNNCTDKDVLVDLGCGVGSHLQLLSLKNTNVRLAGIDKSEPMLLKARQNVSVNGLKPVRWLHDDFANKDIFGRSSLTCITLYYFTVYYVDDLTKAIACWEYWLKPNGYLVVHVVDPKRFDPVLDAASPFVGHSIQAYSKSRRTESVIHFTNFVYKSFFDYNNKTQKAIFEEHFDFHDHPNKRINQHTLKMFSADEFVIKCKKKNLKLKNTVHMIKLGYPYEYLLYFRKE